MNEEISEAHRRTGVLLEETRRLLRGADRDAVGQALARLGEVLEAHFVQEDSLHHTVIAALRPEHRASLEGLAKAHSDLRARYAEVARCLENGAMADSQREFEAFVAVFRSHEAEEEQLLRSLGGPPVDS